MSNRRIQSAAYDAVTAVLCTGIIGASLSGCDSATMTQISKSLNQLVAPSANMLVNGDFEQPEVPVGNYRLFKTNESFPGWSVAGNAGNVAVISGQYKSGSTHFAAQSGKQWLDITGLTNSATGIQQTVATETGAEYELSFYVGNVALSGFGTTSSIEVLIAGKSAGKFTNNAKITGKQAWSNVVIPIKATGASLTITFINRDASNDNSNGLDNVRFTKVPPPEANATA